MSSCSRTGDHCSGVASLPRCNETPPNGKPPTGILTRSVRHSSRPVSGRKIAENIQLCLMFVTRQWEERQAGRSTLPKTQIPEAENQGLSATKHPIAALGLSAGTVQSVPGTKTSRRWSEGAAARCIACIACIVSRWCRRAAVRRRIRARGVMAFRGIPRPMPVRQASPEKIRCRAQGALEVDRDKAGGGAHPDLGPGAAGWRALESGGVQECSETNKHRRRRPACLHDALVMWQVQHG